jgi:outer membrane protein insertion porin family
MKKPLVITSTVCLGLLAWNLTPPVVAQNVPAAATSGKEGKTVTSVTVSQSGGSSIDRDRILANMSLKEGDVYTAEKEEADLKNLFSSGLADNVSIDSKEVGGGVAVNVTLTPRASMGEVQFSGNSLFNSQRLAEEIDLKPGSTTDDGKLQEARKAIEELYANKGYNDVLVSYEVVPAGNGYSRVTFTVNEGEKGVLNDLQFEGNSAMTASELEKVMKADNRGWKFWSGAKLEADKLEEDARNIEAAYQRKGYVNAKVTGMEKSRVNGDKVDLIVRISEGQQFTVSGVTLSGNKTYQNTQLTPTGGFNLESGALFNGDNLKADMGEIKRFYTSRGYADARVTPQVTNTGTGSIAINYAIEEGGIYTIDKINISGNSDTDERVMRREMAIDPGDTFNSTKLEVSERRLRGLGYFDDITLLPSDSSTEGMKDLNITVKEGNTGQLNFGAGFSSIDNLVGFVNVNQRNFDISSWPPVGAGQNFYLNLRAGTRRKDVNIGWYEPWLFDKRLGFGTEAFFNQKTFLSDNFDQQNVGGNIYFRKQAGESSDFRLQWLVQNVTIDNIDPKSSDLLKREGGDYLHNEVTLTYNYDTRDDNVLPRKGFKFQADAAVSFAGDVSDQSLGLQFSKPVQLPWDLIFTMSGSADVIAGDPPIFERAFLGGARDLRGFDFRDVGPKDQNGEPLGGDTAWFLSAELTAPIVDKVRAAVFYDVGEVSGGPGTFGGGVNSNYGVGVRLNLPILGPLRLDYGIPVQADEFNDGGGRFQIMVDYKF